MAINRDVKSIDCFIARKSCSVVQLYTQSRATRKEILVSNDFAQKMCGEKVLSTKEFLYFCVLLCLVGLDEELGHAILFKAFLCHVSFSFDFIIIRKADFFEED